MISALESSKPGELCIKEFKKALKDADIPVDEQLIVTGNSMYRDGFSEQNGYETMKKLLSLNNRRKPASAPPISRHSGR